MLFTGYLKFGDSNYYGPVSTEDFITFHWLNRSSGEDYYFYLKKYNDVWYQVEGIQEIKYPYPAVNAIGEQIDIWMKTNSIT